ncbi:MAG: ATP-dependent zinc metalloprotease FtsH [Candidatus Anoxychlamydiales bacterium]|nr:ATP-dependent zinc metalloprotease FtsH [Candidatus Anoxychlamydiales bacterium]
MTIPKYALFEISPLQADEYVFFSLPVEHGHLTHAYERHCPVYETKDGEIFILPREFKDSLKQAEIKLRPNQIIHSFLINRYGAIKDLIEAIFSKNKVYIERFGDLKGVPLIGSMASSNRCCIKVRWGDPPVGQVWKNYKDHDDIRNVFLNKLIGNNKKNNDAIRNGFFNRWIGRNQIDEMQEIEYTQDTEEEENKLDAIHEVKTLMIARAKKKLAVRPPMPVNKEYGNLSLVELIRKNDTYLRIEQFYSNVYELYPKMVHKFNSELMEKINKVAFTRFFYLPGEQHEAATDEEFSISNCIQILNRDPIFRKGFEDMWKNVSGMFDLKLELFFKVFCPIYDSTFKTKYKQTPPNGVLFYGPPGCGKTHIAKAVANSINAEFIDYSPGSYGSKYQNETSSKIQLLFDQAKERYKSGKRTVIFVDEADSVFPRRDSLSSDSSEKKDSVEQFLRNMESCNEFGVLVICATNFRDQLDPASIRAGRIDLEFELLAPSIKTRRDLFEKEIKGCSCLSADIDLDCLTELTENFPSSSIKNVVLNALNCAAQIGSDVSMIHFKKAIEKERQRLI